MNPLIHLFTRLNQPWSITPAAMQGIQAAALSVLPTLGKNGENLPTIGKSIIESWWDDEEMENIKRIPVAIEGGIAAVGVEGIILKCASPLDYIWDSICDVGLLSDALDKLALDDTVGAVVLDINSPGGSILGTPECAEKIAALAEIKPVIAFTDSQCCSAAYWLAAGATAILAAPTAAVASIGVYIPFMDVSKMYEDFGYKVDLIKTGEYKGMGHPGTSLTETQREFLQARVNKTNEDFRAHIRAHRGDVPDAMMQGQDISAADAGPLVDALGTRADAIAIARALMA